MSGHRNGLRGRSRGWCRLLLVDGQHVVASVAILLTARQSVLFVHMQVQALELRGTGVANRTLPKLAPDDSQLNDNELRDPARLGKAD